MPLFFMFIYKATKCIKGFILNYYYTSKKDKMMWYHECYFFIPMTKYMKKDIC